MSLPGVESARRRRVSHGRSSVGFMQPAPLHRRSCPHLTTPPAAWFFNPPRLLDPADGYREVLNERAIAARHRLHERLRDPDLNTPHTSSRQHGAPSISRTVETQSGTVEKFHMRKSAAVKNAEKVVLAQWKLEDCPVCLDSFSDGERVMHLPCRHTFHHDCIMPWLRNHCDCPSCRAKISQRGLLS